MVGSEPFFEKRVAALTFLSALLGDRVVWLGGCAAFFAWILPASDIHPGLPFLVWTAFVEEAVFRWFLQDAVNRGGRSGGAWGLSRGNVLASVVFAGMHAVHHPLWIGLGTLVPSLYLGMLWDRHKSLLLCSTMHMWFNVLYFYRIYV